ncbi:MAG: cytochrome C551 [Acidithiobacillales bacterium SM23_46]|jgi:cation diffusion facilitator family transporter|nr:MAG: cytochrome C551 [Acidithiobacillales bacterium SM23_46]KPL27470.1 MAG: cytochrome C551 [Acidithiobacillales bacterium SM1_46]
MAHAEGSTRAILFALGANFGIGVAKGAAAWYTNSGAMLAEAIHSFADTANQLLLLLGLKRARRPVSDEHPLGYGKAIYFWSFLVALLLFSMGGMFSVYEGVHKLLHPEMPRSPWVAVLVLVVAIALEFGSLRAALAEVRRVQGRRNLLGWFRTSRQSELLVVVGEDIAALIGLVLALAAVLATMLTGNPLFDALGTIAIGVVLILVAVAVGIEVKSLLIGESAEPETVAAIRDFLAARPEVAEVYRLITLQLGLELMVAVKARMQERSDAARLIESVNRVEAALRSAFPEVRWIFFEPDVRD